MRLLRVTESGEFTLTKDLHKNIPKYAILSHTWGDDDDEVTFKDMTEGLGQAKVGYSMIRFCAKQAIRDGLQHFWVDTCCIDKSSSAELSEAITSMFRWYHNATKCYVYLEDVWTNGYNQMDQFPWEPAFRRSRWFTRGWTLQELIAPALVEFFSSEGQLLGNKQSLERQLHEITGIKVEALKGHDLSEFSVDERFSWADNRETKREEDKAYSLLGIFNIYMSPHYGEGAEHAFRRLKGKIYKRASSTQLNAQATFASMDQWGPIYGELVIAPSHRDVDLIDNGRLRDISAALIGTRESGVQPPHNIVDPINTGPYLIGSGTSLINPAGGMYSPWRTASDAHNLPIDQSTQGRFASPTFRHSVQFFLDNARRRARDQAIAAIID
jgi:Heterokaryon incompatibility protein (HET)